MDIDYEVCQSKTKVPAAHSKACLAAQLTAASVQCEKCITGTKDDLAVYLCMGKVLYLRGEYEAAVDTYARAAAVALFHHLSVEQLQRLRQLTNTAPQRAYEKAVNFVVEYEPTLVYHLGHAWHALSSQAKEHRAHLRRYAKGLRGLAPEAYDPSLAILLHFHDQGVVALRQKAPLITTVLERYYRLAKTTCRNWH